MGRQRALASVAVGTDGRIYAIGGWPSSYHTEVYDPASDTWTYLAPPTRGIYVAGAATGPDGRIYISGGFSNTWTDLAHVYDPTTDSWSDIASLPQWRGAHGMVTGADGHIYVTGGIVNGVYEGSVLSYDVDADTWSPAPAMSESHYTSQAVLTNDDRIVVAGGWKAGGSSALVETYQTYGPPTEEELTASKDGFLRPGQKHLNEGANPTLHLGESRRLVLGFDLSGVDYAGVTEATLVLTIDGENPPGQWGSNGRTIDAHALNVSFTEGNGKKMGLPGPEQTRGSGSGVTWTCATDQAIENQKADCTPKWAGGDFAATASASYLQQNGVLDDVVLDVTGDVQAGIAEWLVKKTGGNGNARFFSRDGTGVAPRLMLRWE